MILKPTADAVGYFLTPLCGSPSPTLTFEITQEEALLTYASN